MIVDIQDFWPDSFDVIQNNWARSAFKLAKPSWEYFIRIAVRGYDGVMAVSHTFSYAFKKRFVQKELSFLILFTWVAVVLDKLQRVGFNKPVKFVYCGSLELSYDLECVIDAFAICRSEGLIEKICLTII